MIVHVRLMCVQVSIPCGTESDGRDGRAEPKHESFEGHRELAVLDDAATEVHDYIVVVMQHWLARGIDGWRLDAAYAVPTGFWSRVRHLARTLVVLVHSRWRAQHLRRRRAGVPRHQGRACLLLARIIAPAGTAVLEGPSHGWEVAF